MGVTAEDLGCVTEVLQFVAWFVGYGGYVGQNAGYRALSGRADGWIPHGCPSKPCENMPEENYYIYWSYMGCIGHVSIG
jgi:hypothetical protein